MSLHGQQVDPVVSLNDSGWEASIIVGQEFTITHRVQFSETDMAGIVHFSNYFRMMEEVEHAFFRLLGMSVSMQHDGLHLGWPRVSAECQYIGPIRFEDEVELRLRVARVGEKSFNYEVIFMVAGQRVALGKITSVCCTLMDGGMQSIAIPPALREKLAPTAKAGGT